MQHKQWLGEDQGPVLTDGVLRGPVYGYSWLNHTEQSIGDGYDSHMRH
jgi:hypothetical protein